MAKLILKTNIHNSKFSIEYKAIQLPLQNNVVELLIKPRGNYKITSEDFYNGHLPSNVKSVTYSNLGSNVVAFVTVIDLPVKSNVNISLPINCTAELEVDNLELTEKLNVSENVIVNEVNKHDVSMLSDGVLHKVKNNPGQKVLVFDKKFVLPKGSYFAQDPSYEINGNGSRFTVVTSNGVDSSGKVNFKLFKVYYTSPISPSKISKSTITFTAKSSVPSKKLQDLVATKKEEEQIYSYSITKQPGAQGGSRVIKVKGVPMSTFRIVLSDSDGKTYNPSTGLFELGGGAIEGTIPFPEEKQGYGLFTMKVRIPKTSTVITYKDEVVTGKPIDHDSIVSTKTADLAVNPDIGGKATTEIKIAPNSIITLSVENAGGFNIAKTGDDDASDLTVEGKYLTSTAGITNFKFLVTATDSTKRIKIERQPLYQQHPLPAGLESTENTHVLGINPYNNWDSGSGKASALTNAGLPIYSDWIISDDHLSAETAFTISTRAEGIGTPNASDEYSEIMVSGFIGVESFGTSDITASIDLLNFLTIST